MRLRAAGVFPALLVLEGVQSRLLAIPVISILCRRSFFWSFHQGASSVTSAHLKRLRLRTCRLQTARLTAPSFVDGNFVVALLDLASYGLVSSNSRSANLVVA